MGDEKKGVCRVCLSSSKRKYYVSLYEKIKNYSLYEQINLITNVDIKENDGFPNQICRSCLAELETAINFRKKCEDSNVILQNKGIERPEKVDVEVFIKKEEPQDCEQAAVQAQNGEPSGYLDDDTWDNDEKLFNPAPGNSDNEEKLFSFARVDGNVDFDTEEKPFSYASQEINIIGKGLNKVDLGLRKSRSIDLNLQCNDCGGYFKSKCKLRVHWKRVHCVPNLLCVQCKRRFKSEKAFLNHGKERSKACLVAKNFRIEGEGKGRTFYCKSCEYKSVRVKDITSHWVIHTGERPYKCDQCPQTCTQLSSLAAHKESAHGEYKLEITCHYCGKFVKGRNRIYRHMKIHTDKGIECQVCHKTLKNRNCLINHMRRHSGHKSFTCEKCAQSFYTLSELANHRRAVHTKEHQRFKCELCDYKAVRKCSIKKHQVKHTDSNIPCTVCGIFVTNAQALILHQRRHFEEKKHGCPFCEKKFFKRDTIRKHVKAKHMDILNTTQRSAPPSFKEESSDERLTKIDMTKIDLTKMEKSLDLYVPAEDRRKSVSRIPTNTLK